VEDRTGVEPEGAGLGVENRNAEHVGRQEVARELNAGVLEAQGRGERLSERRLAHAGDVFDQQVAAGEEARERQPERIALADDDPIELRQDAGKALGDRVMVGERADGRGGFFKERCRPARPCNPSWSSLLARATFPRPAGAVRHSSGVDLRFLCCTDTKQMSPTVYITPSVLAAEGRHPEWPDRLRAIGGTNGSSASTHSPTHHSARPQMTLLRPCPWPRL
jgi:hypothetical protein